MIKVSSSELSGTLYIETAFKKEWTFFLSPFFFFFSLSEVSLSFLLSLKNCTTNCQEVTYSSIQQELPNLP